MSRTRFGLLVGLLAAVVAGGAFAIALNVLDDGQPDPPPRRPGSSAPSTEPVVTEPAPTDPAAPSESTPSSAAPSAEGELATPAWVVVISSEGDEAAAAVVAEQVAAADHPSGVLHSDDYSSMKKGFWVAYAGPYPSFGAAEAAVAEVADDGWTSAYARCAGSKQQCASGDDDSDD